MIERLRVPLDDPERAALEAEVAAEANETARKAKVSESCGKALQKLKVRGLMPFSLSDDKEKVRVQGRRNYFDFVVAYLKEVERQEVLAKHQGRLPAPPGPHVEFMWGEYERLLPEFKHLMGRKG